MAEKKTEPTQDNLRYYEASRAVPANAQKPFSNGSFSGTDINPMWRIKKLTEMFGPAGIGWYTEVLSERAETYGDTVMAIVDINLYVKENGEWSKPIYGTGGNQLVQVTKSGARPSDEGYKKAYTDALSIACKALGIGADIWYSKDVNYDPDSKYSPMYAKAEIAHASTELMQKVDQAIRAAASKGDKNAVLAKVKEIAGIQNYKNIYDEKILNKLLDAFKEDK